MGKIKLSFNLQHMQHDGLPWLLNIDGKDHYASEVILNECWGVTKSVQHSDSKKYGWIEFDGTVVWYETEATIM